MKKRMFFLTIVACLSVGLLACSLNVIKPAEAAGVIISDGFESGNLNAWTATYGTLSINNQIVNTGYYSAENAIVGSTENLYYQALTSPPSTIDLREYVYITSTTVPSTSGDYYEVGGFSGSQGGNFGISEICVFNSGGTLFWGLYYRSGVSFSHSLSSSAISIGWNSLEVSHVTSTGSSNNGEEHLYLNGTDILDVTGISNNDRTLANAVIGGSQSVANPSDSWHYYIDDVVVSSSYIGPLPNFSLTMSANYGSISPGNGSYEAGSIVTVSATAPSAASGERYVLQGWVGSGTGSYTGTNNPVNVTVGSTVTEQATWEHQYQVTFTQSGLGSTASGTAVTVDGSAKALGDLPFSEWVNSGSTVTYNYSNTVASNTTVQRFVATGATGPTSPITVTGPVTVTGNWKTQYQITFSQAGLDHSVSGTIVTVNGSAKAFGDLPFSEWVDSGSHVTYNYSSTVASGTSGEQFAFNDQSGPASPVTVTSGVTVIGSYNTQYYLDVVSQYGTVGGSGWYLANATAYATITPQTVNGATGTRYVFTNWSGNSSGTALTSNPIIMNANQTAVANYQTQYQILVSSAYGNPTASDWVDSTGNFTASVTSPAGVVQQDHQWVCTGFSVDGGASQTGTSYAFSNVQATHSVNFTWKEQFWVTFEQKGLPNNVKASATIDSISYTLPYSGWVDQGATVTFKYGDHLANGFGQEYVITSSSTKSPVTVNAPTAVTAQYASHITTTIYVIIAIVIIVVVVLVALLLLRKRRKTS